MQREQLCAELHIFCCQQSGQATLFPKKHLQSYEKCIWNLAMDLHMMGQCRSRKAIIVHEKRGQAVVVKGEKGEKGHLKIMIQTNISFYSKEDEIFRS